MIAQSWSDITLKTLIAIDAVDWYFVTVVKTNNVLLYELRIFIFKSDIMYLGIMYIISCIGSIFLK